MVLARSQTCDLYSALSLLCAQYRRGRLQAPSRPLLRGDRSLDHWGYKDVQSASQVPLPPPSFSNLELTISVEHLREVSRLELRLSSRPPLAGHWTAPRCVARSCDLSALPGPSRRGPQGQSTSFTLQKLIGNSGPSGVEWPGSSSWGSTVIGVWDPSFPAEQPPSEEEWTTTLSDGTATMTQLSYPLSQRSELYSGKKAPVCLRKGRSPLLGREGGIMVSGAQPPPCRPDALVLVSSPRCAGSGQLPRGSALLDGGCPNKPSLELPFSAYVCFLPLDFMISGHQLGTGFSLTLGGPKCSDHSSSPQLPSEFAGSGMAQCF
ncbi:uncharacterized protein LOC129548209 isoform X2 [Moschus berezovskii]|uniref:uncharacterized protein LOC129548209 isoform X2 n=1 Tax=Moschus berezovskii TaxID=68408 RepID=UPI002444892C|nr:uncharacterized protein LOC129548209 isoform X2 [Moschus berezovskii]